MVGVGLLSAFAAFGVPLLPPVAEGALPSGPVIALEALRVLADDALGEPSPMPDVLLLALMLLFTPLVKFVAPPTFAATMLEPALPPPYRCNRSHGAAADIDAAVCRIYTGAETPPLLLLLLLLTLLLQAAATAEFKGVEVKEPPRVLEGGVLRLLIGLLGLVPRLLMLEAPS